MSIARRTEDGVVVMRTEPHLRRIGLANDDSAGGPDALDMNIV